MPLIVDREERRRAVVRIATRLVAEGGLDGASVRRIAEGAGTSTAIVSHYFRDKRELMLFVYREAMEDTFARMRRRAAHRRSLAWCIEAALPLDRRRRDNWKVWFAFWGIAMADPAFLAQQRDGGRLSQQLYAEIIAATAGRAVMPEDAVRGRQMVIAVTGIATQATYDPEDWPASRQRELLGLAIAGLGLAEGCQEV